MIKHHTIQKNRTQVVHRKSIKRSTKKHDEKYGIKTYFQVIAKARHYTVEQAYGNNSGTILAKGIIHVFLCILEFIIFVPCVGFLCTSVVNNEHGIISIVLFALTALCTPIIWSAIKTTRIDMDASNDNEQVRSFLGNLISITSLLAAILIRM